VTDILSGIRVVELAAWTFVPAAGAVLADWGADVIKVEHAETGDAQRGLSALMGMPVGSGSFAPLMEHPNRGKRSVGLALEQPEALEVLHELIRTSDVFLTNFLPDARTRLRIDLDDEITRETLVSRAGQLVNPRVREAFGLTPNASEPEEVAQ